MKNTHHFMYKKDDNHVLYVLTLVMLQILIFEIKPNFMKKKKIKTFH